MRSKIVLVFLLAAILFAAYHPDAAADAVTQTGEQAAEIGTGFGYFIANLVDSWTD